MKTSIALVGFMGVGKTAVGKALAESLGKGFIELDSLIEQKAGKSIPDIFRQDGEIGFRELEIGAVKGLVGQKQAVIACGGGVVLNKINIDRLKKECVIVYLMASPSVILDRVASDSGERPLLGAGDTAARIRELMKFRQPYYQRAADITMNTSKLNINSVVARIINRVKADADFHCEK